MIVTALIMSVANPGKANEVSEKKETLLETVAASQEISVSDNEEKEDIKELADKADKADKEDAIAEDNIIEESESAKTEEENEDTKAVSVSGSDSDLSSASDNAVSPPAIDPLPEGDNGFEIEGDEIDIKVISGDSSVSVSRRLFEAGLVESAVEFDKFLCENGYDKLIRVGTFTISEGSDFETIAHSLTGR